MTRVLVVDDDPAMVGMVAMLLGSEGFEVVTAYDGEAALRKMREDSPDLVVLDMQLPRLSGDDVTRRIRETSALPIIMLTGRKEEEEKARLLELGADDYLTKPFGKKELVARVRALLRRASGTAPARAPVSLGGIVVDASRHSATAQGKPLDLTPIEFRLLEILVRRGGDVVAREQLLRAGWPDERDPDPEWLKPHLARLRMKLGELGAPVPENVRGVGYRLG
ncbi:MAG TPA: response regulator transcription factor [Candidatus Dormibacteraeota bacterium]|nr:response regulator transcription factor [Candidatus Dormibacteraeota bacterium]